MGRSKNKKRHSMDSSGSGGSGPLSPPEQQQQYLPPPGTPPGQQQYLPPPPGQQQQQQQQYLPPPPDLTPSQAQMAPPTQIQITTAPPQGNCPYCHIGMVHREVNILMVVLLILFVGFCLLGLLFLICMFENRCTYCGAVVTGPMPPPPGMMMAGPPPPSGPPPPPPPQMQPSNMRMA